jgi:hypothetical protein
VITLGRAALGALAGAAIGAAQYAVVVSGMKRADRADGLSGIGVAAGAAAEYLILTVAFMLAAAWLLGMRLWGLAGISLTVVQLVAVAFLFDHSADLGLHGHRSAILFAIVAAVGMGTAAVWWPRRAEQTLDL